MLGIWSRYSSQFLYISSVLTFLFAVPMLFSPIRWASVLKWRMPKDADLAIYFGRCLGGVVTVLACCGVMAASWPAVQKFYFLMLLAMLIVNILVHIAGAIQRIQPIAETVEIAVWVALFLLGLAFLPKA